MSNSFSQTASLSHVSNHYEQCTTPGGVYDQLVDKISEIGNLSLGGADYSEDFNCRITEQGNYKYVHKDNLHEHKNAADCHFIFSQICPMSLGTQLSSRGSNINYKVCTHNNKVPNNSSITSTRTKNSWWLHRQTQHHPRTTITMWWTTTNIVLKPINHSQQYPWWRCDRRIQHTQSMSDWIQFLNTTKPGNPRGTQYKIGIVHQQTKVPNLQSLS